MQESTLTEPVLIYIYDVLLPQHALQVSLSSQFFAIHINCRQNLSAENVPVMGSKAPEHTIDVGE